MELKTQRNIAQLIEYSEIMKYYNDQRQRSLSYFEFSMFRVIYVTKLK